jgi:hypothetical protein
MEPISDPSRRPRGNPNFIVGQPSANPHGRPSAAEKRAAVQAKIRELAAPFGGVDSLDVLERVRIEQAAKALLSAPRRQNDWVRTINVATRLIRQVEQGRLRRRREAPPSAKQSLADVLEARKAGK